MESLHQRLGPYAVVRDPVKLGVEDTPHYDPYEDKLQNVETLHILDKEPEVTPEWGDKCINKEILLPRGKKWPETECYIGREMSTVDQIIDPIRTPFCIHTFMSWNFQCEKLQICQLISLQNQCMPNVMLMGMNIFYIRSIHQSQKLWVSSQCKRPENSC